MHIYIEKLGERKLNRIHFKAKLSNKTVYIAAFVHAMYAECAGADYTSPSVAKFHMKMRNKYYLVFKLLGLEIY